MIHGQIGCIFQPWLSPTKIETSHSRF